MSNRDNFFGGDGLGDAAGGRGRGPGHGGDGGGRGRDRGRAGDRGPGRGGDGRGPAGDSRVPAAFRIGIDLGGTKMEGVLMAASGEIAHRRRVATPAAYDDILRALSDLTARLRREAGDAGRDAGVGMSMPGTATRAGLIKNSNTVCLNGRPFPADVRRALDCEVRFANDADCLALSEATDGAAAGSGTVFAVILGTGVGGGIAVNARVVTGPNRIRGEWGHAPLPWPSAREYPGPRCYCGRRGCMETFVSGTGMENDYERATGRRITARDIAVAAEAAGADGDGGDGAAGAGGGVGNAAGNSAGVAGAGADDGGDGGVAGAGGGAGNSVDPGATTAAESITVAAAVDVAEAVAARRRYAHRLARGLAMMVNILDPDVIVLGGGMSNMIFLYRQLPALMRPWIFGGEFHTPIRQAAHGDSSGVRGAAWL
ncbi:MAG: ROK family protein, partial [Gammaproteobacteria bacterium]|nr:ROK family protein [Gammaproteobacteria bacterium]